MGFDFGAFFAGAAQGAGNAITARNKEIRTGAISQFDELVKEANAKEKGLKTERDTLATQAKVLAGFRGMNNQGLTQNQILGLIQQPENAKRLIKELEGQKDLSQVDLSQVFQIDKPGTAMAPEDFLRKKTSIPKGDPQSQPTPQVKGAFGLSSPAYNQAEQEFLRNRGRSIQSYRDIATGTPNLGADFVPMQGNLNLTQFAKPEAIADIKGKIRDNIANGVPLSDPKNEKNLKKLVAAASIEAMLKDKNENGDDGKPRTTSQIRTTFADALQVSLNDFVINKKAFINPQTGEVTPIIGDPDNIISFQKQKQDTIKKISLSLGILDDQGNITKKGGRNAFDALLPYANIENNKVVSWKADGMTEKKARPAPAPKVGDAPAIPTLYHPTKLGLGLGPAQVKEHADKNFKGDIQAAFADLQTRGGYLTAPPTPQ